MAGCHEVNRHRRPDQSRAEHGQQGEDRHQHSPKQDGMDPQHPKAKTAQSALQQSHHDIALNCGAHHGGEGRQQIGAHLWGHGDGGSEMLGQAFAIAKQEKDQIQRHPQPHHQPCRALADGKHQGHIGPQPEADRNDQTVLQAKQILGDQTLHQTARPKGQLGKGLLRYSLQVNRARGYGRHQG